MGKKANDIRDIFIEGRVQWAVIQEPKANAKSRGIKSYSIDIEVDDKKVAALQKAGVKIGTGQYDKKLKEVNGVQFLTGIKRKELKSNGDAAAKLTVIGADLKPFTESVGNGSTAKIKVALIPIEDQTIMYLKAVQILDHVVYNSGDNSELSGFSAAEKDDDLAGFGDDSTSSTDEDDDLI